jgi:hypothetical protein
MRRSVDGRWTGSSRPDAVPSPHTFERREGHLDWTREFRGVNSTRRRPLGMRHGRTS